MQHLPLVLSADGGGEIRGHGRREAQPVIRDNQTTQSGPACCAADPGTAEQGHQVVDGRPQL